MSNSLKVGLIGASGRMGLALQTGLLKNPDLYSPVHLIERQGSTQLGKVSHVNLPYETLEQVNPKDAQVWIDFSLPTTLVETLAWLDKAPKTTAYVLGVTGLSSTQMDQLEKLSHERPIFYSTNMSTGIAILNRLAPLVMQMAGDPLEIEIDEIHHNQKIDQPSGTALTLAHTILEAWGIPPKDREAHLLSGYSQKKGKGEKVVHCISHRRGQWAGEHTVHFATDQEEISLKHVAHNRSAFAKGALQAARWVSQKGPGLYSIDDMLHERLGR